MKRITLIALFLCSYLFAYSQTSAPIRPAAKLNVSVATGSNPYTLTVSILDDLSRFTFADFGVGDSVYLVDGSDLLIYVVTSKLTSPNRLVVNDVNNTGISAPTGQGAIIKSTANYKLPVYVSGLRDDLRSMIMNRFSQLLDGIIYTASNEIYRYVGTTGVAPAVTAAVAGAVTAQNTVGEIYTWNPATNLTSGAWSIVSGTGTSSNGLTTTTGDTKLGGTLTQPTVITANSGANLLSLVVPNTPSSPNTKLVGKLLYQDGSDNTRSIATTDFAQYADTMRVNAFPATLASKWYADSIKNAAVSQNTPQLVAASVPNLAGAITGDSILTLNAATGAVRKMNIFESWDSLNIKDNSIAARDLNKTAIDTVTTLVPTVAYMKTLKRATGAVINTQGFTTNNDGGGARYVIEATGTVDNMTTFLMADGKFAKLQANSDGGINLLQVGVKIGNGIDYQPNIQKAFDNFSKVYCMESGVITQNSRVKVPSNRSLEFGFNTVFRNDSVKNDVMLIAGVTAIDSNITIKGGVWDFNKNNKTSAQAAGILVNPFIVECGIYFLKTRRVVLDGVNVKNVAKYAYYIINFDDFKILNCHVHSPSDAIHVMKGQRLVVDNFNVEHAGDDIIALDGGGWSNNRVTGETGNISDVAISNIFVHSNDLSNLIAMFPGNDLGSPYNNYTIKNVKIDGLYGTVGANALWLASGSTYALDALSGGSYGGVLENISVSNVYVTHGVGYNDVFVRVDTIKNLILNNMNSPYKSRMLMTKGYIDKMTINGAVYSDIVGSFMEISDTCFIKNLHISDAKLTTTSPAYFLYNHSLTTGLANIYVNNSTFTQTGGQAWNVINSDSVHVYDNNNIYNTYQAWNFRKPYAEIQINGSDYSKTTDYAIYSQGAVGLKIKPVSYTPTTYVNGNFGNDESGTISIENSNEIRQKTVYAASSPYNLPTLQPIGTVIKVVNNRGGGGNPVIVGCISGSETINGASTFTLQDLLTTTFTKTSATNWFPDNTGKLSWNLGGNNTTSSSIGTTNNYQFTFLSNNIERMRIEANGYVYMGPYNYQNTLLTLNTETGLYSGVSGINPIALKGLRAGATTDSLITSNAGILRRMALNQYGIANNANSNTTGLRINQLTTSERDAWRPSGALAGDFVFNTTLDKHQVGGASSIWQTVATYVGEGNATINATIVAGSNLSGGGTPPTITVTNAAVGDYVDVMIVDDSNDLTDINVKAWVSATNTVSYQIENKRATSIVFTSKTLKVRVKK